MKHEGKHHRTRRNLRRLVVAIMAASVALTTVAAPTGATAPGGGDRSGEPTRVTIKVTGKEYESRDPNSVPLNGTGGACPHSNDVSAAQAPCWTWAAKRLGHGVAILALDAAREYVLTLIACDGDMLFGDGGPVDVIRDPTPYHAIGHVNRFPQPMMAFTGTDASKE